jgi:hypothetical protein
MLRNAPFVIIFGLTGGKLSQGGQVIAAHPAHPGNGDPNLWR